MGAMFQGAGRGGRSLAECQLVRKETLCETRGEPVRRLTFAAPADQPMNVDTALRQVVVVPGLGPLRMYSPTSEPNRPDGTFDLVVRVYQNGQVSRALDAVPVGSSVKMIYPWPAPLSPDRRNPGQRIGLIAFGVGITELYRVAANELRDPQVQEVALLYSTRTAEEQRVMDPELAELVALHPGRFRLERTLTGEPRPGFRTGRVDAEMLAAVFPWADGDRANARFLASGSGQMMKDAMQMLDRLGYQRETCKLIRDHNPAGMAGGMMGSDTMDRVRELLRGGGAGAMSGDMMDRVRQMRQDSGTMDRVRALLRGGNTGGA